MISLWEFDKELCWLQVELDDEFLVEPQHILDRREIMLWKWVITQVKVQWKHFGPYEATWEDERFVHEAYPELFPELEWNTKDNILPAGDVVTDALMVTSF